MEVANVGSQGLTGDISGAGRKRQQPGTVARRTKGLAMGCSSSSRSARIALAALTVSAGTRVLTSEGKAWVCCGSTVEVSVRAASGVVFGEVGECGQKAL